ncbi:TetR/AcrR family transcriptional regulator [Methylobacterium fujisawaense]|uniref:TetR/AcrR family transcriptional regulator n=1 Tax=Methylobacterium fujisawaense TaxID=107400 RepID=UPI002F35F797
MSAAEALFRRYGPGKTTVADIARDLSMSTANVYKHFQNKSEIFEIIGKRRTDILRDDIDKIVLSDNPAWIRIEMILEEVDRFFDPTSFSDHTSSLSDFINELLVIEKSKFNNKWSFIEPFHEFVRCAFTRVLENGVKSGELSTEDPNEAGAAIFDCFSGMFEPLLVIQIERTVRKARRDRQLRLLRRAFR